MLLSAVIYYVSAKQSIPILRTISGIIVFLCASLFILHPLHYENAERAQRPPNVIFILTDTLRYDVAMQDGLFESFKEAGETYSNCYSTSSWTIPSVFSIFTGLYPYDHGAGRMAFTPRKNVSHFPEILQNAGYDSACIQTNELIMPWVKETFPIFRYKPFGDAKYCVDNAVDVLGQMTQPLFLYVHFMDTHMPYTRAETVCIPNKPMKAVIAPDILHFMDTHGGEEANEVKKCIRKSYLAEAQFLSQQIHRLITILKARNLYNNTLIIIASDHGEEFWDHGHLEHGHQMFSELIHVPLFIHLPHSCGRSVPRKNHDARISFLDIMPTILAVTELKGRNPLPGISLLQPLPKNRRLLTQSNHYGQEIQSLLVGNWHFIHYTRTFLTDFPYCGENPNPFGNRPDDLFNLADDPLETESVINRFPTVGKRMRARLEKLLSLQTTRAQPDEEVLTREERERLKSIGYLR